MEKGNIELGLTYLIINSFPIKLSVIIYSIVFYTFCICDSNENDALILHF